MTGTLRLLHPFMPYLTEEIWQALPHDGESVMVSNWPEYDEKLDFPGDEADFQKIIAVIRAIRNRRAEMSVPLSQKTHVYIETPFSAIFEGARPFIQRLGYASKVEIGGGFETAGCVRIVAEGAVVYIPLGELVDIGKEIARLEKEKSELEALLRRTEDKLGNEGFISRRQRAWSPRKGKKPRSLAKSSP